MKQVILLIALGLLLPSVSAQAQAWRETDGKSKLQTGKDMNAKYRETSKGGLAVKVVCS